MSPMQTLLSVVGEELTHLAAAVERLHDVLELSGSKEGIQDARSISVLQGIDHVTQHLSGLSDFFRTLAPEVPGEWEIDTSDASEVVLIATLSERLRRPAMPRPQASDNDECEFF